MPKGIPQKGTRNRQNKKETITDAAMRVFCFYGFFGATIEKIANEAGVSPALVLRYYANKEEIAVTCVRRFLSGFSEKLLRLAGRNLTYLEHVDDVFEIFKVNRAEMRFIINILCTPALESISREINQEYMGVAHQVVAHFSGEIAEGKAFELAYAMNSMYFAYVIGGNEENYLRSREALLQKYLIF